MKFCHLHVHSVYSILDGAASIDGIISAAKKHKMEAVALTDHGYTYGLFEFYRKARAAKIKPILGCEFYVSPYFISERDKWTRQAYHLVLLARNARGHKNLLRLASIAATEGFYYTPRVDEEVLSRHSEGIIALSGCLAGMIPQLLLEDKFDEAAGLAKRYAQIFRDGFYLEIQNQRDAAMPDDPALAQARQRFNEEETRVLEGTVKLAKEMGIPLVATNDVHYINRADAKVHDVLLAIQTHNRFDDKTRLRFPTDSFHFRGSQEMQDAFRSVPEAIASTVEIANMCDVTIDDLDVAKKGVYHIPVYDSPFGDPGLHLRFLCEEGFQKKIAPRVDRGEIALNEYRDRLEYELSVIYKMGFASYFLILWDVVNWCRSQGIPTGPGRGSACGSLASCLLGITKLDPIEHRLLFERFLNPDRVSMPDIDLDVDYERRGEVLEYLAKRYGETHVSQILTVGTMATKAAIKKVATAFGVDFDKVNSFTGKIPSKTFDGKPVTIADALKYQGVREIYVSDPEIRRVVDFARNLEGVPSHVGIHAAGVVIADKPISEYVAVKRGEKDTSAAVAQCVMEEIESLGLLKMDFLGLRTLTVIDDTVKHIRANRGIDLDIDSIPLDDEATYDLYSSGNVLGVFQVESGLFRGLLNGIKPRRFDDIVDILALGRPGPLKAPGPDGVGTMVEEYIRRRSGERKVTYEHLLLENALKPTSGILIYQEQVMQIARDMAGYTKGESDSLRKAIGKKLVDKMAEHKEKFISGAIANGVSRDIAEKVWNTIETFGEYGFNRSHSAGYALVSYQTAYLKAHYPTEFMAALLSSVMTDSEEVAKYLRECRRLGIKILPPDVNVSTERFTPKGDAIAFGLAAVVGVGRAALGDIFLIRQVSPITSPVVLLRRGGSAVNVAVVESLIKAGAWDSQGYTRRQLLESLPEIRKQVTKEKAQRKRLLKKLGKTPHTDMSVLDVEVEELDVPIPDLPEYSKTHLLEMEKEVLGFYVSGHPVDLIQDDLKSFATARAKDMRSLAMESRVVMGGVIKDVKVAKMNSGFALVYLVVEDGTGTFTVMLAPREYAANKEMAEEGRAVFVHGKVTHGKAEPLIRAEKLVMVGEGSERRWLDGKGGAGQC